MEKPPGIFPLVVLVAALWSCGNGPGINGSDDGDQADGPWFEEDWSAYTVPRDLDAVYDRMVSYYASDGGQDGEILIETDLQGTPWGGDHGARVVWFDRSVVPCSELHDPEVGVRVPFPDADVDRPREIWYEAYVQFDSNFETAFCDSPFPENKFLQHYDQNFKRWNMMVGSANPERWIRYYINDIDYSGAPQISAKIPPSTGPDLDSRDTLWDGQWHQLRGHYRMGDGDAVLEAWIDGVKVFDVSGVRSEDTKDPGVGYFAHLYLSSNQNQRPDRLMSVLFGRYRAFIVDPG